MVLVADENEVSPWQVTTLDFLRHGKPQGGEIFRGLTDVSLTDEGFASMQSACDALTSMPRESDFVDGAPSGWQQVVSSPLLRCHDFARAVSEQHNLPLFVDPGFREVSFGDWDGVSFKAVARLDKQSFDNFWRAPTEHTPPNGEPFDQFFQRVVDALARSVKQFKGQHALVVAHGGVIRAVLSHVLGVDAFSFMRYEVPYACISRIRVFHDQGNDFFQLCFHNR